MRRPAALECDSAWMERNVGPVTSNEHATNEPLASPMRGLRVSGRTLRHIATLASEPRLVLFFYLDHF